jgi:hypothetical protein
MQIFDCLRRHATDAPDTLALREIGSGEAMTWSDLAAAVDEFAGGLKDDLPRGSVVMLRCPNVCDFHVAFLGILSAGMTVFPVPHEIARPEFDAAAADRAPARSSIVGWASRRWTIVPPVTGRRSCCNRRATTACRKSFAAMRVASMPSPATAPRRSVSRRATGVLSCVPLCHSYGLEHACSRRSSPARPCTWRRVSTSDVVRRELRESAITAFPAVPSIYEMLGNLADDAGHVSKTSRRLLRGGPLPASVFARIQDNWDRDRPLTARRRSARSPSPIPMMPLRSPLRRPTHERVQSRIDDDHQLRSAPHR